MPGKANPKNLRVGPFSKGRNISSLDRRTKAGRVLRTTIADLRDHLGGHPSPAEALLVQSASLKATRLYLLSEKLLAGGEIGNDGMMLAWLNSMRQDLTALGLQRRERDITPDIHTIAASLNGDAS